MLNRDLCASALFHATVAESLSLACEHSPKEIGFSCWLDDEKVVINKPIIGDDHEIRGHHQFENPHQPLTGFHEGEGSQTILDFHTHPADGMDGQELEEHLLRPSINDVSSILAAMQQNRTIAELYGRKDWINPISIIASPSASRWSIFQIDADVARRINFDRDDLWGDAVWEMYKRYYPQYAKRGTGATAELFAPGKDRLGRVMIGASLGRILRIPQFLVVSTKRYQEFLKAGGVTWIMIEPSELRSAWNFAYLVPDFKEEREEDEEEEDEDDIDWDRIETMLDDEC